MTIPRNEIAIYDLKIKPFDQFDNAWFLLTSGDYASSKFNCMTVSWGSMGVIWGRPFVQVVVRPTRYTYEFINQYDTFTLCSFPEEQRKALDLLGSKSGRNGDKIAEAGLTPIASKIVAAPAFAEAELIIECQKMYWDDLEPRHFLYPGIDKNYNGMDYHRSFFGEVLRLEGEEKFQI